MFFKFEISMEPMEANDDSKSTEVFKWDDTSTRLMLNFYKTAAKSFGKVSHLKTKLQLWVHVIEELSKYGYNVNPKQAQNRLITLQRSYKKRRTVPSNRQHQGCISALFDDDIKEILERRRNSLLNDEIEPFSENSNLCPDLKFINWDDSSTNDVSVSASSEPTTELNRWDPKSTKLAISAYLNVVKTPSKMRSFKKKNKLWQYIADKVNSHGYYYTGAQTKYRFRTLIRSYKKYLEKKRCGIRAFFMFESEIREVLKNNIAMPNPEEESDGYDDDDDEDDYDDDDDNIQTNDQDIDYITVEESNIDGIEIISESESFPLEFTQPSNLPNSSTSLFVNENYAILNELKLLRKSESQFYEKMVKTEQEKLDLMRQNNILLKILIEKLSRKS